MRWQWVRFSELSVIELYEVMVLRQRVFALEQNCVYQDADGLDQKAWHLLGWTQIETPPSASGPWSPVNGARLDAYLRAFPEGVKYPEPSIGRVVTAPEARGTGAGRKLMIEALRCLNNEVKTPAVRISAQAYLEKFYTELGFRRVSAEYLEDGIPHIEMLAGQ